MVPFDIVLIHHPHRILVWGWFFSLSHRHTIYFLLLVYQIRAGKKGTCRSRISHNRTCHGSFSGRKYCPQMLSSLYGEQQYLSHWPLNPYDRGVSREARAHTRSNSWSMCVLFPDHACIPSLVVIGVSFALQASGITYAHRHQRWAACAIRRKRP